MTALLACRLATGQIVLAADRCLSFGSYRHLATRPKLFELTEGVAIAGAGEAAAIQRASLWAKFCRYKGGDAFKYATEELVPKLKSVEKAFDSLVNGDSTAHFLAVVGDSMFQIDAGGFVHEAGEQIVTEGSGHAMLRGAMESFKSCGYLATEQMAREAIRRGFSITANYMPSVSRQHDVLVLNGSNI